MARPRKPTAILELSGAFRHNPDRRRPHEPKEARPLGEPPARLPVDAVPYWWEIADMVTGGVLTYRDRWAVEWASRLMASIVAGTAESTDKAQFRSLLASFGMTPSDRSKLSIPTNEKPVNRFAALAEEVKATKPN